MISQDDGIYSENKIKIKINKKKSYPKGELTRLKTMKPRSKSTPSKVTVLAWPPKQSSFSYTTTSTPALAIVQAETNPLIPLPITATLIFFDIIVFLTPYPFSASNQIPHEKSTNIKTHAHLIARAIHAKNYVYPTKKIKTK